MRFPTEGKKHGFFTSSLCSKGKDVRTLLKKWAMCGQKRTPENYERYEKEKPAIKWSRNIGRNAPIQPAFRIGSKYYIYYMGNIAKCQENLVNYPRLKS